MTFALFRVYHAPQICSDINLAPASSQVVALVFWLRTPAKPAACRARVARNTAAPVGSQDGCAALLFSAGRHGPCCLSRSQSLVFPHCLKAAGRNPLWKGDSFSNAELRQSGWRFQAPQCNLETAAQAVLGAAVLRPHFVSRMPPGVGEAAIPQTLRVLFPCSGGLTRFVPSKTTPGRKPAGDVRFSSSFEVRATEPPKPPFLFSAAPRP